MARRRKLINMVVPPDPFSRPVAGNYEGDVFIWDLDKTYLKTEFDSLKDLLKTAFEKAAQKVAYPGASAVLQSLNRNASGERRPIYFISASPPQMRQKIQDKFRIDQVEVDGIYFKDNMRNLRPGRLARVREQMGYKLMALLDLRRRLPPGAVETLFGDDMETDVAIYSLYSQLLERWLKGKPLIEFLKKQGVFHDEAVRIAWMLRYIPKRRPVHRIYVQMHRNKDPRYYRRFGKRVVATTSYFQTAAALFQDERISFEQLKFIVEHLRAQGVPASQLGDEMRDLVKRGLLSPQNEDNFQQLDLG